MVIGRRVVLLVVVVAIGALAVVDWHWYRVSFFTPGSRPERVQVCGRSFRAVDPAVLVDRRAADARHPERGPFERVGELRPPLHASMEILGHPGMPQCGMELFVGADDEHLAEYGLMGGP